MSACGYVRRLGAQYSPPYTVIHGADQNRRRRNFFASFCTRRIETDKLLSCLNVGIVYLLVLGAVAAGIITGVFKPDYKGKVIYFAIHRGNGAARGPAPMQSVSRIKAGYKRCNFWMASCLKMVEKSFTAP
ncbi:hypothetical protein ANCCAN_05052 [Ancylostoma caninum]|uniref:Uncharacterized protein n=1 Tax=Ancylostoma caninum TaxID=29170 RepID=A0A368GX63_ANCCA|nr:hypothetical protein ANCCAN_05052 [Ancylostoma caninum]